MIDATAIIVAAGASRRMGTRTPKPFLRIGGCPILIHTIRKFSGCRELILVLNASWIEKVRSRYGETLGMNGNVCLVKGGTRRQDSVQNGLREATRPVVLVHDVARPFVSRGLIKRVYESAKKSGAAVPVIPVVDTLRRFRGKRCETVDRNGLFRIQTPQGIRRRLLVDCWESWPKRSLATDEIQIVESAGKRVVPIEGEEGNFKITTPRDLQRARKLLK